MPNELPPFLVNQTRWSDVIKNLGVVKGLDHVQVAALLSAAIVLENDRPEHKYLAGEALAGGQYLLAAPGAAIVPFVGLRNPAGSGKIVIVQSIRCLVGALPGTATRWYVSLVRGATLTAQSTEQPFDTRLQPLGAFGTFAPNIVGQIVSGRSDTIAVTPFVIAELVGSQAGTVGTMETWREPIVLAPNDTVILHPSDALGGNVSNVSLEGSFTWRERTLEPTET